MKQYISEEEKKRQIEQMWAEHEKANHINRHANENTELLDIVTSDCDKFYDDPIAYEKTQRNKKKSEYDRKKSDKNFE